jgi:hypothetical protein
MLVRALGGPERRPRENKERIGRVAKKNRRRNSKRLGERKREKRER